MARRKRLLIGLGNPGDTYVGTRHNVGFAVIDRLAEQWAVSLRKDGRAKALTGEGRWGGFPVILAKPQTWMNRSGQSVRRLQRRYGLANSEFMVIVDDIHLPVGRLRVRPGGSAGGHNGLQDIIDSLEADDFPRLRIGVGSEFSRGDQSSYVLSPFTPLELEELSGGINQACAAAKSFVTDGLPATMNRFNRRNPSDEQS